jgi:hypothetical protein
MGATGDNSCAWDAAAISWKPMATPLHAKQVELDKLAWAIGALAEGLGIRAVARVFEADPNAVLDWLIEAAEHLEAFSHYFLRNVNVAQVQMDELFALLSAVKECAAGRGAESLTQSGEVRRETSGSSDLPEGESRRGQEHAGEAGAIGRRVGWRPARPARYGESWIA